jgi:hypothetical protein
MTADQLLTMKQVAIRLSVSLQTAYRRVYGNQIKWTNVALPGHRAIIRVAESDLARYLEARRVAA